MSDINAYAQIHSIFHSFQGEGLYTGTPCVFVRFQGCSVGCPFCDTKEAQKKDDMELIHIENIDRIIQIEQKCIEERVVLTGGEPFEQAEALHKLLLKLMFQGKKISIETSGTVPIMDKTISLLTEVKYSKNVHITLSPKHKTVYPEYISLAKEYKILVSDDVDNDIRMKADVFSKIRKHCSGENSDKHLFFQPTWYEDLSRRQASLKRAMDLAQFYNARLSVQMHKYLNIP